MAGALALIVSLFLSVGLTGRLPLIPAHIAIRLSQCNMAAGLAQIKGKHRPELACDWLLFVQLNGLRASADYVHPPGNISRDM